MGFIEKIKSWFKADEEVSYELPDEEVNDEEQEEVSEQPQQQPVEETPDETEDPIECEVCGNDIMHYQKKRKVSGKIMHKNCYKQLVSAVKRGDI